MTWHAGIPGFSLSACKKEKIGIQPSCSVFDKGPFGELSSKSEEQGSSELCSTVSPSTHLVCSNIVQLGENINKCYNIAARQAAEGDILKELNKHTKIQKYEECSSSLITGGRTRSFSGSPHGRSNDVITVRTQRGGSVRRNSLFPNSQLAHMRGFCQQFHGDTDSNSL